MTPRHLNAPIQPAMARPISSGESSWTKWIPGTVTSVCAGHPRTTSSNQSLARTAPGSAFTNSFGTSLQDHLLSGLGTQRLQERALTHLVPVVPRLWPDDRLHVRDTPHGRAMAVGPVEAEGRTPVVEDKGDPLAHIERLEQAVEEAPVLDETVRAGAALRQLLRITHADQVGRDTAPERLQVWQNVAPEVGRGGITVQQHDGIPLANVHVGHLDAKHPPSPLLIRKLRRDHARPLPTSRPFTPPPAKIEGRPPASRVRPPAGTAGGGAGGC